MVTDLRQQVQAAVKEVLVGFEGHGDGNLDDSSEQARVIDYQGRSNPFCQNPGNQTLVPGTVSPIGMPVELSTQAGFEPHDSELLKILTQSTFARIGVGRAGTRPKTNTLLTFRADHAAAIDAVFGEMDTDLLEELGLLVVTTLVSDKDIYIRRPDLGRRLTLEAIETLKMKCIQQPQVQVVVSDGLSSQAIIANLRDVYSSLCQSLKFNGLAMGTPFYVSRGRVAVMDQIGEILQPDVVVLLIGERPGLVAADSMSAYLCYRPRRGTVEADRMVLSNIHRRGTPPVEAGAHLGDIIKKILEKKASGVNLAALD